MRFIKALDVEWKNIIIMKKLKYIFLSLLFLGVVNQSNAQVLIESFENTGPNCGAQAFLQGCFPQWINTHGSARAKSSSFFDQSFDGSRHVKMYVDKRVECSEPDRGEGILLYYLFEPGQCYRLSYAIKGRAGEVAWMLTSGIPSNGDTNETCSGNDVVPDIPAGSVILPGTNFSLNSKPWVHIQNIEFTPTSNFIQLWFRASNMAVSNPNQYRSNVFLDLVKIEECCYDCEIDSDLSACPDENDFGFMAIDCPGEYEWDFPAGSTATEVTSEDQSLVVNASPGLYAVTVTDAAGCVTETEFEVPEVCCERDTLGCVTFMVSIGILFREFRDMSFPFFPIMQLADVGFRRGNHLVFWPMNHLIFLTFHTTLIVTPGMYGRDVRMGHNLNRPK